MKLYSPKHGNSKDGDRYIQKSKHEICYSKVLTKCLNVAIINLGIYPKRVR